MIYVRSTSVRTLLSTHFAAPSCLLIHSSFSSPLFSLVSLPLPVASTMRPHFLPLLPPFLPPSPLRPLSPLRPPSPLRPTRPRSHRSRARRW
ncbi:hypothetical protein BDA96_03G262400 [Sorghum bicolor]|uniref:Uncharacterized protein n=1 Tax=Sorghum bicolor TaxID=4558 RepID=A0A921RE40_SORBI|nr:hypothetical protein BDA96_03G262400 [Sorghum bicolor]